MPSPHILIADSRIREAVARMRAMRNGPAKYLLNEANLALEKSKPGSLLAAIAKHYLGLAQMRLGHYQQALDTLQAAISSLKLMEQYERRPYRYVIQGIVQFDTSLYSDAARSFTRARELAELHNDPFVQIRANERLGRLYALLGLIPLAERAFQEAIEIGEAEGDAKALARAFVHLALSRQRNDSDADVEAPLMKAQSILVETQSIRTETHVRLTLADLHWIRGAYEPAREQLARGETLLKQLDDLRLRQHALFLSLSLQSEAGASEELENEMRQLAATCADYSMHRLALRTHEQIAAWAAARQQWDRAYQHGDLAAKLTAREQEARSRCSIQVMREALQRVGASQRNAPSVLQSEAEEDLELQTRAARRIQRLLFMTDEELKRTWPGGQLVHLAGNTSQDTAFVWFHEGEPFNYAVMIQCVDTQVSLGMLSALLYNLLEQAVGANPEILLPDLYKEVLQQSRSWLIDRLQLPNSTIYHAAVRWSLGEAFIELHSVGLPIWHLEGTEADVYFPPKGEVVSMGLLPGQRLAMASHPYGRELSDQDFAIREMGSALGKLANLSDERHRLEVLQDALEEARENPNHDGLVVVWSPYS